MSLLVQGFWYMSTFISKKPISAFFHILNSTSHISYPSRCWRDWITLPTFPEPVEVRNCRRFCGFVDDLRFSSSPPDSTSSCAASNLCLVWNSVRPPWILSPWSHISYNGKTFSRDAHHGSSPTPASWVNKESSPEVCSAFSCLLLSSPTLGP